MAKRGRGFDVKALLLAHSEKGVVALVAIVFVMMIWSAIGRPGMPGGLEPSDIESIASSAKSNIQRTKWEDFLEKPNRRNYNEMTMEEISLNGYRWGVPWNPPLWPGGKLRTDPKFYPVQELEAHFDFGPLALLTKEALTRRFINEVGEIPKEVQEILDKARDKPEPPRGEVNNPLVGPDGRPVKVQFAGEELGDTEVAECRRWAMVTGLIPLGEQIEAYDNSFRDADGFDIRTDRPLYLGYEVERAEVTGAAEPEWQPLMKVTHSPTRNFCHNFKPKIR